MRGKTILHTGGLFFLLTFILSCGQSTSRQLFVSPSGSDTNDGSRDAPFQTLTGARDCIRGLDHSERGQSLEVILSGGTYFIDETIVFSVNDGGNKEHSIRYRAAVNEVPVISSGRNISHWEVLSEYPGSLPEIARGKVWAAEIPADIQRFHTLFDGYERLPRARSKGFQSTQEKFARFASRNVANPDDRHLLREITFPGNEIKNWDNPEDIEVFFSPVPWCLNFSSIDSVDEQAKTAYLKFEANSPPFTTPKPYNPAWVENVIDFLDEPGEWVLDMKDSKLYYWPVDGSPGDEIFAPQLREHIRVEGEIDYEGPVDNPVENLHFEGIHFVHGDRYQWWEDHKGWGIQHDWDKFDHGNALLRFRGAENCSVSACRFTASGNSAIRLDLHCQHISIEKNLIDHVGHMGILLAGYGPGTKDVNMHNRIVNNIIDHVGEVVWHGHAIFIWQSGENYVAHNLIQYCPRKGVGICGVRAPIFKEGPDVDWDEASKTLRWHEIDQALQNPENVTQEAIMPYEHARNNLVEKNYLYRLRSKIGDGAALNVSGAGPGNVLRNNFLGEVVGNGLRTDDWQRGTLFESNIITDGGIVHKGFNHLKNNILYNTNIRFTSYPGQVYYPGSEVFSNIIYFDGNPVPPYKERTVKEFSTPEDCILKNNVYYHAGDNRYVEAFLSERIERGWEYGSESFDPGFKNPLPRFRDPGPADFIISSDSRVFDKSFLPIDTADIGILDDYPEQLRSLIDPMFRRELISGNADFEASSIDKKSTKNRDDFASQTGDEEMDVVLSTKTQNNPFLLLDLKEQSSFNAFTILAPMAGNRDQLRTLTVWVSDDGLKWRQIWKADSYHGEMPRRFDKVFENPVSCRYLKAGLQEHNALKLKSIQLFSS
ncbi:MAG: hypothetical protein GY790_14310 [Bacteroidetes bacterium]|nr:hypothetical protein [Bacteroidota bacterium]